MHRNMNKLVVEDRDTSQFQTTTVQPLPFFSPSKHKFTNTATEMVMTSAKRKFA